MKKISFLMIVLLVLSLVAASFAGCAAQPETAAEKPAEDAKPAEDDAAEEPAEEAGEEPAAEDEKYLIGFSQCTLNHPWRVAQVEGNKAYAATLNDVELIVTDGQNNATKQISDVEDLIAREVDVLILSPLTAEALTGVAQKAMDAGIKVVTLDRKVECDVTLHIGAENKPIGEYAAKFVNEKLGGEGKIIEIQGTAGASATIDRHDGFVEELANYPGLEIVAEQYCDYLRENAVKFMEDMLQRFGPGEIDVIYAHNDGMALGAITALEDAGRADEGIIVIGVDGEELAIQAVKDGIMALTVTYPYCAPEGMEYAYKLAKGEDLDDVITLVNQPIDETNVDEWLGKGF